MSIVKSLGKIIGALLFTFFLTFALLSISLVDFTSYSNLKSFAGELLSNSLSQQVNEDKLNQIYDNLKSQCVNKESTSLQLGETSVKIDCSTLANTKAKDLFNLVSANLFDSIYNKSYSCDFLECIRQTGNDRLLVLVSQHANNFLKSIQLALWALAGIGALLMYFSLDTMQGRLKTFGSNLAFSGGSYLILTYATNYLIPSQLLPGNIKLDSIINNLFGKLTNYFIIIFIVGILLLLAGYLIGKKKVKKRI